MPGEERRSESTVMMDLARKLFRRQERRLPDHPMAAYALGPSSALKLAKEMKGELAQTFFAHRGRIVHKWVHFLDVYERHFARYRGSPVRMLEIGVFEGGSLELWREYFGPKAVLFGIDIDARCRDFATSPTQVRIGSQDDPDFLRSVVAEMGGIDIVLDDGSHIGRHQEASFRALFPLLEDGGLYAIEDMHTSYWPDGYDGGYKRPGTAVELVKQMIDDMHGWYHAHPVETPAKDKVKALHVYDSITVVEKGVVRQPGHIQVG